MFLTLCSILLVLIIVYVIVKITRPKFFPPGPTWYPIVGNSFELKKLSQKLGGQDKVFEQWTREYGSPIIGLKLGSQLFIVVTTYPLVKAVHTRDEFNGRPDSFFLRLRTMGTRLGITCTDGTLWSEHRNFTVRHLREAGYGRKPMEQQIKVELDELLTTIDNLNKDPIWPRNLVSTNVINVLWTFTAGKRFSRTDKQLKRLMDLMEKRSKAFDVAGGLLNQIPWLRHIAPEYTGYNLINSLNEEFRQFFLDTIHEHYDTYSEEKANDDLIYSYIKEMRAQESNPDTTFTEIQLIMTILDIFIAGSQTTSITIDLVLMIIAMRPEVQNRVHKEIDSSLKNLDQFENYSELQLPYTKAVIFEVQRFFNVVPVSGPRRTLQDTTLGGFRIPEGTTVLIGLKSAHMDAEYWDTPEEFMPERFLNEAGEIVNTERLMPFGQGKRKCLGDALAKACIINICVGILRKYSLTIPEGAKRPSLDLLPGIVRSPRPYTLQFSPRL